MKPNEMLNRCVVSLVPSPLPAAILQWPKKHLFGPLQNGGRKWAWDETRCVVPLRAAAYSFWRLVLPLFCSTVKFFALLYDLAWHLACGMNSLQCQCNFSNANCSKFYQELQKEVKIANHIMHLSSCSIKGAETRNNKKITKL